ncbi:uncharacterized protein LOC117331584 [Pecten maximus]|uniref:uncharacterized protein LOC117331584 n=1 Tax=Pecten maximus TaxID=6579 RepID=UPI0014587C50|nr:uncharacterized protein LOC117331584 [Pecten maximus]
MCVGHIKLYGLFKTVASSRRIHTFNMSFEMKVPLSISLVSLLWQCVMATTTTDAVLRDEYCSSGYYTFNSVTRRVDEVKYYISCPSTHLCCGMFENRHCCIYQSYNSYDYPSTNAIIFGSIAGAIMFLSFIVCAIAKWRRPFRPVTDPHTLQALQAVTGGNIPRTPFTGLILSSSNGNVIQTSTTNTQEVSSPTTDTQTTENTAAPPPRYEDCIQNNLILPSEEDKPDTPVTNHTDTRLEHVPTHETGHHINTIDSVTCL